jgi:hypothetical protein
MRTSILPAFDKFREEGEIVGRLLAGYADLEIGLMHCVSVVRTDFDTALKVMFRDRGETRRINIGDAFGRQAYKSIGLEAEFASAVSDMRYCLKARNLYAHSNWYDDHSGKLAFVNLEELAELNVEVTDLTSLTVHHVDKEQLQAVERFFVHTDAMLAYANYEGRLKVGKLATRIFPKPPAMTRPALFV